MCYPNGGCNKINKRKMPRIKCFFIQTTIHFLKIFINEFAKRKLNPNGQNVYWITPMVSNFDEKLENGLDMGLAAQWGCGGDPKWDKRTCPGLITSQNLIDSKSSAFI